MEWSVRFSRTLWHRTWLAFIFLAGCAQAPVWQTRSEPEILPPPMSGPSREFLFNGFDEDRTAMTHAYVLLARDQTGPGERERFAALAEAFWKGLVCRGSAPHYGVAWWPLDGLDSGQGELALEHGDWEQLADHYHHDRARLILERIQGLPGAGPHLIVAWQPLGQAMRPFAPATPSMLVIDFSNLPPEKFLPVMRVIQTEVQENPWAERVLKDLRRLEGRLRPWLGDQTRNTVWIRPVRLEPDSAAAAKDPQR